jgi:hypothetical protein
MDPGLDQDQDPQQCWVDSQGKIKEETVNAMGSIQANFMTMDGRSRKNGCFQRFNGTYRDYLGFKRWWITLQETYYASTPGSKLTELFCDHYLEKEEANKIEREETMAACWRMFDAFYNRPRQLVVDLMAGISVFGRMEDPDYERLPKHYNAILNATDRAEEYCICGILQQPANIMIMESKLPSQELELLRDVQSDELWRDMQGDKRSLDPGEAFKEFIVTREPWGRWQVVYTTTSSVTTPPPFKQQGAAQTSRPRDQPTPAVAMSQLQRS